MIDEEKRNTKWQQKEKVRRRMRVEIDPDNYEYIPEKKKTDYYDTETPQLVGIYVRVSTDDVRQTTSFELQKKYYEEFVSRHPNWTLVKIYADEGISGTSLKNRDEFKQMIADAKAGKLTLIITKSVSRFARNQYDFIGIVRELAERKPAVGVFFESEAIFSLNEDSSMALSFQATMAEEESHTRSRSMETSLRMRLDHGLPLTPKLLGYSHDADGNLIINPDEAPTVKLAFYMYLFGYSSGQIAKAFIALERKSYLGNTTKWTSGSIIQILRNERHCGDVITRKTYTENYRTHRTLINKGDRPQSHYSNHHEAIVSKADYIAVQHMIENARYGNRAFLPELRVIDSGILKGFVGIHPRWANFKEGDYFQAAVSVYDNIEEATETAIPPTEIQIEVAAGDFDLRGFEVARAEFFNTPHRPYVTFADKKIKFNTDCIRKLGAKNYVELLVNPITKKLALRPTDKDNRQGVYCSTLSYKVYYPKDIPASAFFETLYRLFGWNTEYKYKINGSIYEKDGEVVFIFDTADCETYFKSYMIPRQEDSASLKPLSAVGNYIKGYPEEWMFSFGKPYYFHERSVEELENQSEIDWQLRIQGQLFETGKRINVTPFEELRRYIRQELSGISLEEVTDESI